MGELFKLFGGLANPLKLKLVGLLAAALVLTNAINFFVTKTVYYNKGVNVSKVAIATYETEVAKLQHKVDVASGIVKDKVITVYKDRVQYVDRVVTKNGQTIIRYVAQPVDVNGQPVQIPAGWAYAHNQAALGLEIDPTKAQDMTPTTVTFSQALVIISENYGTYQKLVAQVKGWQTYYTGLQQVYLDYKNTEIKTNDKK
jgi:hypothetical protein